MCPRNVSRCGSSRAYPFEKSQTRIALRVWASGALSLIVQELLYAMYATACVGIAVKKPDTTAFLAPYVPGHRKSSYSTFTYTVYEKCSRTFLPWIAFPTIATKVFQALRSEAYSNISRGCLLF